MDARPIGCLWEPDVTRLPTIDVRLIGCFWEPDVTRLAAMDARPIGCLWEPDVTRLPTIDVRLIGCFGNRTLPGWQRWMLAPSDALGIPCHSAGNHGSCLMRVSRTHLARPDAPKAQYVTPAVFSALRKHAMCLRTHAGQVRRAGAGVVVLHGYGCSGPETR